MEEKIESQTKTYVVGGDYENKEGNIEFNEKSYEDKTAGGAIKQAQRDGLVRLASSFEE